MQPLAIFGPVDAVLEPIIGYVVLVLVLVNMGTRLLAHRRYVRASRDYDETAVSRWPVHTISNLVLLLASFYFLTFQHHAGMVLSVLVIALVITDFFEFESLLVEIREERSLSPPRAAIAGSVLVLLYISYITLFFIVKPFWDQVV